MTAPTAPPVPMRAVSPLIPSPSIAWVTVPRMGYDRPFAQVEAGSYGWYRALTGGYVRGAGDLVDAELRAALGTAPAYMAYMLGLRFLVDYLDGDRYFRVAHAQHNLIRSRSQFRLFRLMADARADMHRIARRA